MAKTIIEGIDFGIPVSALRNDTELLDLPPAMVESRDTSPPIDLSKLRTFMEEDKGDPEPPARKPERSPVEPLPPADSARNALRNEAQRATAGDEELTGATFEFEGDTYTLGDLESWDINNFEAVMSGHPSRIMLGLRREMGKAQWEQFCSRPDPDNPSKRIPRTGRHKRTFRGLEGFLKLVAEANGVTPGESGA